MCNEWQRRVPTAGQHGFLRAAISCSQHGSGLSKELHEEDAFSSQTGVVWTTKAMKVHRLKESGNLISHFLLASDQPQHFFPQTS